jgi:hypothetical protein
VSGTVATIDDPELTATTGEFTNVQINWGDGTSTTPGTVVQTGEAGTFQVMGTHAYARYGVYPISVSLHDNASGADVSLSSDLLPASISNKDENSETVAVNPLNPNQIFVAANTNAHNLGLTVATSTDGGETWKLRVLGTGPVSAGGDGLPPTNGYHPHAIFDQGGRLFLSYVQQDGHSAAILQSTDGGQTFTTFAADPSLIRCS